MTHHFCSITDKNFLVRLLALHESLIKLGAPFKLWTLCLDQESYEILNSIGSNVIAIKLADLNDAELEAVKSSRRPNEFAWTCKPSLILNVLSKIGAGDIITYVDADIYFYSSPIVDIEPVQDWSIIVTPHRFPDHREQQEKYKGRYNAGLITFRATTSSGMCLDHWRKQCLDWCFSYYDNGRLADQLYLNEWKTKYSGVVEAPITWNVGPWNICELNVTAASGGIFSIGDKPIVCYHFHGFKIYLDKKGHMHPYPITVFNWDIYNNYTEALKRCYKIILDIKSTWNSGFSNRLDLFRRLKQFVMLALRNTKQKSFL